MISVIYSSPFHPNSAPIYYITGLSRKFIRMFPCRPVEKPNPLFGQCNAFLLENTHHFCSVSCGQQVSWFLLLRAYIILVSFLAKFSGMVLTYWCPRIRVLFRVFLSWSTAVAEFSVVRKSTSVKLCQGLNRKSFTGCYTTAATTHTAQNPVVPVTCHLIRLSRPMEESASLVCESEDVKCPYFLSSHVLPSPDWHLLRSGLGQS